MEKESTNVFNYLLATIVSLIILGSLVLFFINLEQSVADNINVSNNSENYSAGVETLIEPIEPISLEEIMAIENSRDSISKKDEEQWAKNNKKAAKIKAAHPEWTRIDCEMLAERKYWIGMRIEMLKYVRGLPNSANPSNYGSGTSWQWCWYDYTPSCFYDNNDDGRIDAYN